MSKRFGRNQRRRLREENEALYAKADQQSTIISRQRMTIQQCRDKAAEQEETIGLVRDVLGRHFVALPPETLTVDGGMPPHIQMLVRKLQDPTPFGGDARTIEDLMDGIVELSRIELERIEFDKLRGMLHVYVHARGGRFAYGLSDLSVMRMGKNAVAAMIAKYLSKQIANHPTFLEARIGA